VEDIQARGRAEAQKGFIRILVAGAEKLISRGAKKRLWRDEIPGRASMDLDTGVTSTP
jgi:hypothetical protein